MKETHALNNVGGAYGGYTTNSGFKAVSPGLCDEHYRQYISYTGYHVRMCPLCCTVIIQENHA